jgi:uncharacterized membrane protein
MTDVYQAPSADLRAASRPFAGGGSIESGLAGNYEISIGAILSEAWSKTKGAKSTVWLALLFYMIVLIPLMMAVNFILAKFGISAAPGNPMPKAFASGLPSQLIQMVVSLPLTAGYMMIGIKLAVRAPVEATELFAYFPKVFALVGTAVLMYVLIIIGFCLLVLPGIYLAVAYGLAMPLVVEKNLSPWEALETSRKAITHHWFGVFGLYIVFVLIAVLATIPLGIGLIWVMPMMLIAMGIVYRTIFGYEGVTLSESSMAS